VELLRRGYNFTDSTDGFKPPGCQPVLHRQSAIRPQFIPMQTELSRRDLLNVITHTGTGILPYRRN
jgi:hypothetical protein